MTLLVGVHCKQGAVFAADKQASHGAFGVATVAQPTTKITAVSEQILFASSGPFRALQAANGDDAGTE